jgi:hypothetical protein
LKIHKNEKVVYISHDFAYEYFEGTIDEVRVWDTALNATQILENMCANFNGSTDPHLIANFKFNECGGTMLTDVKNGNDGELINMEGDEWIESLACPGYAVTFLVLGEPGSSPIEAVEVNMSRTVRYTYENGQAIFEGYKPATYTYHVSKDGFEIASGEFDLIDENLNIEAHLILSRTEDLETGKIIIYPNPTSGLLEIQLPVRCKVEIVNPEGLILLGFHCSMGKNNLDLSDLPKGFYYVRITGGERVVHHKIVLY